MTVLNLDKYLEGKGAERREQKKGRSVTDLLSMEVTLLEKKFGPKEKEGFYSELGLLLSTGVDIKTALDILEEDIRNKKHKAMLQEIKNNVISGMTIYEAISRQEKVFSKYEAQSIRIGEETGKLPDVLKELGKFFNASVKLKR